MKILLTNNHLAERAGSELLVTELAEGLRAKGHDVSIFALFGGAFGDDYSAHHDIAIHTPRTDSVLDDGPPDVVHVTHWPTLLYLRDLGIDAPAVHAFLGVLPPLENPPPVVDGGPPLAWAVSEEVAENVASTPGWPSAADIAVVRNWIAPGLDGGLEHPGPTGLRKLAVVSNHFPAEYRTLLEGLAGELGFELEMIGLPDNSIEITADHLLACDAVVSLGRTAIAAAGMGIPTLVLDANGADGWVTPDDLPRIQRHNYSGRAFALRPDDAQLRRWLTSPPDHDALRQVSEIVRRDHSFATNLGRVETMLLEAHAGGSIQRFGRHCDVVTAHLGTINHLQGLLDTAVDVRNRTAEELADERRALDDAHVALDRALAERDDARRALAAMEQSTSWRITAPVRASTDALRRRRG